MLSAAKILIVFLKIFKNNALCHGWAVELQFLLEYSSKRLSSYFYQIKLMRTFSSNFSHQISIKFDELFKHH